MSKRSRLKEHIVSLDEISNIIGAMKNLSLLEISKVNKRLPAQSKLLEILENSAVDFLTFYPEIKSQLQSADTKLYILLGSERGFCGDFNELVLQRWRKNLADQRKDSCQVIAIGDKLIPKITDIPLLTNITGANVTEEIQSVVLILMQEFMKISADPAKAIGIQNITIIYNKETDQGVRAITFSPLENFAQKPAQQFSEAPLLYLSPQDFFIGLLNQYLFTILHQIFYQSFIAENRHRLRHMDSALDWVAKKNTSLKLVLNQFRQEEITEEIEVVLSAIPAVIHKK